MKSRQMDLFESRGSAHDAKGRKARATSPKSKKKPAKPASPAREAAKSARKTKGETGSRRRTPKVAGPESPGVTPALADEVELEAPAEQSPARAGKSRKEGSSGRVTAETLAGRQREISVSEFFTKNRHLLGFDNPSKALLTTVKEAVDNALDACEEAHILPDLKVEITEINENRFRVAIEDNGPGIVKAQIPKIFAKLLYGSKFHRLRQSRGQQGIGISAAGLYAQLTTGKPMVITSRTGKGKPAHQIHVLIDTAKNQPKVLEDKEIEWDKDHGTRVELELVGAHRGGRTSIDAYIEQTIVANPHVSLTYKPAKGDEQAFPRATDSLPREPVEIKPHPHGVELGMLMRMLHDARGQKVKGALVDSFSRVSPATAQAVCDKAGVSANAPATGLTGEQIEKLHIALGETKVMAPPSSAVVPIGEDLVVAGLRRRYKAEIYEGTTRPPAVYRGNPFVVEAGIAYGGELPLEESAEVLRFANRVPLQYQPGACAITEAIYETNWKNYTLQQPKGSLPVAPMAILVHLASVWVPFTSEAKEAVAHYDDILREIRFALQECGRKLAAKLRARDRAESEARRRNLFQRYIPELGDSIGKITGKSSASVEKLFYSTLPNFVKNLEAGSNGAAASVEEAPGADVSGENGEAAETNGASEQKPKRKGRAKDANGAAPVAKKRGKKPAPEPANTPAESETNKPARGAKKAKATPPDKPRGKSKKR
jgi:DNA topoisomerase VI subunit B